MDFALQFFFTLWNIETWLLFYWLVIYTLDWWLLLVYSIDFVFWLIMMIMCWLWAIFYSLAFICMLYKLHSIYLHFHEIAAIPLSTKGCSVSGSAAIQGWLLWMSLVKSSSDKYIKWPINVNCWHQIGHSMPFWDIKLVLGGLTGSQK